MRKPKDNYEHGVRRVDSPSSIQYWGKAEALIAAGILSSYQVPGQPGMPTTSASFVDGQMVDRYARPKHDERWMQISLYGNGLRVIKGVSRSRPSAPYVPADDFTLGPRDNICASAAEMELSAESTVLRPGHRVQVNGHQAVVAGEYMLRKVVAEHGEFVLRGERFDYLPGYTCRDSTGVAFFCSAHEIKSADGQATHIRLVRARSPAKLQEPSAASVQKIQVWPFPKVYGGLP